MYKIVSKIDKVVSKPIKLVEEECNELIKEGYVPVGGLSVCCHNGGTFFPYYVVSQSMFKQDKK